VEIKGALPQQTSATRQSEVAGQLLRQSARAGQSDTPALRLKRWLERLALAGIASTFFLLGYWYPITLIAFAQSWVNNPHYSLITLYNDQFQVINLFPSDISALATIILWLLALLVARLTGQQHERLTLGPATLTFPFLGLTALTALSATQAIFPVLSLEIAFHLLVALGFILALLNLRPPAWMIILPLALLLVIEGALALAQVAAQSTLFGAFLFHWNQDATAGQSGASIVQLPGGLRWLRAYGSIPQPNVLGGFLCLALPLVAGAFLRLPKQRRLAWLLLGALTLGGIALLLSFSRAAWLGVLAAALWAGLLRSAAALPGRVGILPAHRRASVQPTHSEQTPSRSAGIPRRSILLVLVAAALLIGLTLALRPALQSRLLLDEPTEQQSVSERIVLIEASAVLMMQHPWLGVGAGNMPLVELSYPATRAIGAPVHNIPLLIGAETGLVGLLLWLIPPLSLLWATWRRRRALPANALAASAALVALLVAAQLDHYLWSLPTASLFYWLVLALVARWQAAP
jgi:O-antigen ligase